jgi:hypothetical protein
MRPWTCRVACTGLRETADGAAIPSHHMQAAAAHLGLVHALAHGRRARVVLRLLHVADNVAANHQHRLRVIFFPLPRQP